MKTSAILLAALGLSLGSVHAQTVPLFINYQGTVTDGNGTPLGSLNGNPAPVNRKVIFRLYGSQNGNDRLWSEQQTVTISLGQFSVLLGQGTDAVYNSVTEPRPAINTVFTSGGAVTPSGPARFLEIVVDDGNGTLDAADLPITPRQRITSTAYSFRASVADSVPASAINTAAIASNSVTTVKITDGAVNGAKIADGTITGSDLASNIGVWTASGSNVYRSSGNVGIGVTNPAHPLSFSSALGDKISLWGGSGDSFGFGIQGALLQIHSNTSGSDIAFGYGSSAAMTERMRIKGSGNVGIGTSTPTSPLSFANQDSRKITFSENSTSGFYGATLDPGTLTLHAGRGTGGAGAVSIGHRTTTNTYTEELRVNQDSVRVRGGLVIDGRAANPPFRSVKRNTAAVEQSAFQIAKGDAFGNNQSNVIDVRTFSFNGDYNFELFEGNAFKPGGGSWGSVSDRRLKKDIQPLEGALDRLLQLKPSTFAFIDPEKSHQLEGAQIGFIAQEVEEVFPDWVTENADGYKTVTIRGFESLAVAAFSELRAEMNVEVKGLREENSALKSKIAALEAKDQARDAKISAILERLEAGDSASSRTVSLKAAKGDR